MKRLAYLGLLAIAVAGCEETTTPNTVYPSNLPIGINPGTRLSPKLRLADDGTIFPHSAIWNDSKYGECVFRTAADGQSRCLPNVVLQTKPFYLDPSCVQEIFIQPVDSCTPMGTYALVQSPATNCNGETIRVMNTGKKVAIAALYAMDGDQCLDYVMPNDAFFFLLETEVPSGEFVSVPK